MSVTKSEYRDLQRRYLGPEWPEEVGDTIDEETLAERMGVPLDEVIQDLKQLREQVASVPNAIASGAGYTREPRMSGKKGILSFFAVVAFCMVLFVILMASIQVFIPKDRNFKAKAEPQKSGEVLIQPN